MYDLTGKIALVTGIGGPVESLSNGKAIAMLLARQGAIIEGTDIDEAAGANTVAAIRDAGGMSHCSRVNATDQARVEKWIKECAKKHGRMPSREAPLAAYVLRGSPLLLICVHSQPAKVSDLAWKAARGLRVRANERG